MGLIGNLASLLASGSRYVPPPSPSQTASDSTGSTFATPRVASGPPSPENAAAAPPPPTFANGPGTPKMVQPSRSSSEAAAQSVPRQGTPADTSPARADFGVAPRPADEDAARAYAVAAQAGKRLATLVKGLADAPEVPPVPVSARAEKPELPLGGAGINATLSTLRGESTLGAVLDKVA